MTDKPTIREWIVVEGKDDIAAVKKAVHAQVIATSGLGLEEATLQLIQQVGDHSGVIVLTDPDFPGEKIRRMINDRIPGCKNAYLAKADGLKNGNVGVENASPQVIRQALKDAKYHISDEETHRLEDLLHLGLLHGAGAKEKRRMVGEALGIGYANAKQFMGRINSYAITPEQLGRAVEDAEKAMEEMKGEEG